MKCFWAVTLVVCFCLPFPAIAAESGNPAGDTNALLDGIAQTVAVESILCERDTKELEAALKAVMKKTANSEKDFLFAESYYLGRLAHHTGESFKKRGAPGLPEFCETIKETMPTVTQALRDSLK